MRVHYLQHTSIESIGAVGDWICARGHEVSSTRLYLSADFPHLDDLDLLVIMGGPMNIYEHEAYPWLSAEKEFIRAVIAAGKKVLGICLGAQLIADVLGGPVTKNPDREIGWFPVMLTPGAARGDVPVFVDFPAEFIAFHAHGDTFAIPDGALRIAASAACPNQAFTFDGGRVVGLQFHLEWTPFLMSAFIPTITPAESEPWVQAPAELQGDNAPYQASHALLFVLLDRMAGAMS